MDSAPSPFSNAPPFELPTPAGYQAEAADIPNARALQNLPSFASRDLRGGDLARVDIKQLRKSQPYSLSSKLSDLLQPATPLQHRPEPQLLRHASAPAGLSGQQSERSTGADASPPEGGSPRGSETGESSSDAAEQQTHRDTGAVHFTFTLSTQLSDRLEELEAAALHRSRSRRSGVESTSGADADRPRPSSAPRYSRSYSKEARQGMTDVPPLCIVMLVVGTRGDVQPFIALGLKLQEFGHRVRLATHATYRQFVEPFGLEFFPLGGDPKVLSEYMVKHRGILPNGYSEVVKQRKQLKEIIWSCWPACTEPDPENPDKPFKAEAIIANPVSYGHLHCAEKLGVPLHMFFTMPWTPTKAFPHPMARIMYDYQVSSRMAKLSQRFLYFDSVEDAYAHLEQGQRRRPSFRRFMARNLFAWQRLGRRYIIRQMELANRLSYLAIDDLLFPGMADLLDTFRTQVLQLPRLTKMENYAHALTYHAVPFTYCWSPSLVPKPEDWDEHIDVVGFFTMDLAGRTSYSPPQPLLAFLAAGPPPVYIGFGSLVLDDPVRVTAKIYRALAETGQRALISPGWGDLGTIPGVAVPANILLLGNTPHDWLFPRCASVIHHGGAGTTAAGLLAGCPTTVVPFFGDQPFWGAAIKRAGVGPAPIPVDSLRRKKLVEALTFMARPEVKEAAIALAKRMQAEDGVTAGVESFHHHLPIDYLLEKRKVLWSEMRDLPGSQDAQPPEAENGTEGLSKAQHRRRWSAGSWYRWYKGETVSAGPTAASPGEVK